MNRKQRRYKGKGLPRKHRDSVLRAMRMQESQDAASAQGINLQGLPPAAIEQLIESGILKEIPQDEIEFARSCGVELPEE